MKLNCDLGESFGAWKMPMDTHIMAIIDQANIACGFHAGDPTAIKEALNLATEHGVEVGAHPAYPDLQGFGRRSIAMQKDELVACIQYQVSALCGLADIAGTELRYVKPHGALYNDMMRDATIMQAVMEAVAAFKRDHNLSLMVQATTKNSSLSQAAKAFNLPLIFEGFADRRYTDDGFLMSRNLPGAVLSEKAAFAQARQLIEEGTVTTASEKRIALHVDSLCVHGDTAGALEIASNIAQLIKQ
ncbi:5-oxoprolinase subunit PxpA [Alteromonas sp. 345S023]|uniref:5-oxoprolinase subunit PxpA n=1 Tax=Alteromonas profundi TaxID=2696062 RepID=A0A7X5LIS0_9ALTE|nr:5-oxoprolinase subunit PxpA [Alteromonas profundi]NDV90084.1 5-oxoprolinase subunit PxpA [Alteromonas profundi]